MRFVILIKQPQVHISFMLPIFRPALTNKLCMYVCMYENRCKLSEIIKELDKFAIGETNET